MYYAPQAQIQHPMLGFTAPETGKLTSFWLATHAPTPNPPLNVLKPAEKNMQSFR